MSLILFDRLESSASKSVVGPGPTFSGSPSFSACKFGNGVNLDSTSKYVTYAGIFPAQIGSLSIWIKPHIASTSSYTIATESTGFFFVACNGANTVYIQTGNSITGEYSEYHWTLTFSIDELFHLAITWDGTASSNNKIKLYKNNSIITPAGYDHDATWQARSAVDLIVGHQGAYNPNSIFDNIKLYNHVKTDFTDDMNRERSGMNDQVMCI